MTTAVNAAVVAAIGIVADAVASKLLYTADAVTTVAVNIVLGNKVTLAPKRAAAAVVAVAVAVVA